MYLDRLMSELKQAGYQSYTLRQLCDYKIKGAFPSEKIVVLRHDIDTDPRTAWIMAKVEKENGFLGTFYFRLSTSNDKYMRLIADMGHEVSYHYEEIASYSKKHKLRNRQQVVKNIEDIREIFANNLLNFRRKHKLECRMIASHGE